MKNDAPIFWPGNDINRSLQAQREANYNDSINILQTQWLEADTDQRFALGDANIYPQLFPNASVYRRNMSNFNIINPIIQAITGQQRQTRKSSMCIPIHDKGQKTADQLTKCLFYVHGKSQGYNVYSDAFEQGALTKGIGLIGMFKDYSNDPISSDIKMRYIDFNSILIDPFFRQSDLSDCRFISTRQFFDKEEACMLYPDHKDQIMDLPPGNYRDDKFWYMPEVYQIQIPKLLAFDEYWYLATREVHFLIDPLTEETHEIDGDEEDFRVIQKHYGKQLKIIKRPKQTVRRQIIVNNKIMVDEADPNGIDRYPYAASLGYFSPNTPYYQLKFRGIVRDLRHAQYLFIRRKIADLDILESQQQGIKMMKGALVTPEDSLNSGNGRVLVINPKNQMDDVQPMQIIPPSPVMLQMEEMLMSLVYRIAGVDPSAMGIDVDDKAGIISMMRQAATARNLQRLFDQCDEMQRNCGEIILGMIQKNWTYGKVKQVIGEEPTPEFDSKLFSKFNCKVVQGSLTETQVQLELAQLLHAQKIFGDIFPPDEIMEVMTIQNKDRIIEKMQKAQEAKAQQDQAMSKLQMQQMQVDNQTKISYANSQDSLAAERMEKIQTDKAVNYEKIKRSQEEETGALLNLIKAVKELDGMDIMHLQDKLNVLHTMKDLEDKHNQVNQEQNVQGVQS